MPVSLLPASAAAFAPRAAPTVVLNSRVEPWLTQTLKRVNRVKRPLNSVPQHFRCLTETLAGEAALWTLCSIMVPKAPDSELRRDSNPLVEALFNYQIIHVEAYVVHVDMVSQHEVAFKLTADTIESLIEYHKDIFSVDMSATTYEWPEKDEQLKKLQEEFVQAVNRYVFRTSVRALEGLEEDGAGELLEGRGDEVKNAIMSLFLPLLPPPPRIVDVMHPAPMLHNSMQLDTWWQPMQHQALPAPVESWRVVPSTPSPPMTTCAEANMHLHQQQQQQQLTPSFWSPMMSNDTQMPSPTPSLSHTVSSSGQLYDSPPFSASIPALPLPSVIASQCGSSFADGGFAGFPWTYNDFAPQYVGIV